MPPAKPIALLGTGSDVGKSLLATGILRLLWQEGIKACPFKAQNMSNNSHVTLDGLEMGRAQAVQAYAAKLEPQVLMNPVLLKPSSNQKSQVILNGLVAGPLWAGDFLRHDYPFLETALAAYHSLAQEFDVMVIEGAGSLAEVNLRKRDIANLGFAQAVQAPVILVADIDRGGVFAQIVGSLEVLEPEDKKLIKGIIINRFRGNVELFQEGKDWIEERTGLPILGIIPFLEGIKIPAEDSASLSSIADPAPPTKNKAIAIIQLPRISNFTDFDPLMALEEVDCHYLKTPRDLNNYDLLILPGSKSTLSDLAWLRASGWDKQVETFHQAKKPILGVCGGYQMLGEEIIDPDGCESEITQATGFGFLPLKTKILPQKTLQQVRAISPGGQAIKGYEIHQGVTNFTAEVAPFAHNSSGLPEGAYNPTTRVMGTYIHGLFEEQAFLQEFLSGQLGLEGLKMDDQPDPYEELANRLRPHLDLEKLKLILEQGL